MMNIIKLIPLPIWLSLALYRILNIYRLITNKNEIEQDTLRFIQGFYPNLANNRKIKMKIVADVKKSYVLHLAKPQEYFLFHFKEKKSDERSEYITDFIKDTYLNKYAKRSRAIWLQNKFLVYQKMMHYFQRDACMVFDESDKEMFLSFVNKHKKFIAKPNTGSFGANTTILNIDDIENAEICFNELLNKGSWILEELIEQVIEMGQFNPSSVNSVRIPTFRTRDGDYIIFGTFMRMGRMGSIIDNAGGGGIFVKVDESLGKIVSDGYTEAGYVFDKHPDTKVPFKGFQIPHYNELRNLAIECHKQLPDHKYIGWDFALTKNGWVLLEGNWGQFLCQQVAGQKALKKEFISLITR